MAYLIESDITALAQRETARLQKSTQALLNERADLSTRFDVFLSHSSSEPDELLLGAKLFLAGLGLSVYVDKFNDPGLSRNKVTRGTASVIRWRMRQSNALLYLHSQHSTTSRWMPWELGFFDGAKRRVGVLPVLPKQQLDRFVGEEYLNLYPYVDKSAMTLWINSPAEISHFARLVEWVRGTEEIKNQSSQS